jgi:hypothetical protein
MPFTIPEALADLPAALTLINKIQAGVAALPKPPEAVTAKAVSDLLVSVLPDLAALIDTVREQAAS